VRHETLIGAEVFRRRRVSRMSNRKSVPTYRLHKQSGQAVVTLTDGLGGRRDVLLGRHGTPESRLEYARVISEWEAAGRRLPPRGAEGSAPDLTISELILAFWRHAEKHYRHPDGTPTSELGEYQRTLRVVKELYGHTEANRFGPLALKAVRQALVASGCCRGVVNQRVGRVRRMFRWASENELVRPELHHALCDVRGLQKGRSEARETGPVAPVALAVVEDTLPYLNRHVRGMVEVQLLTGARPGEVCAMRGCDIDMTGAVWLYRPGSDGGPEGRHKTAHHGHGRIIAIGPKAQEVIRQFLKLDTRAYLFCPREAMEEVRAERHDRRKSKVQPSQRCRAKKVPRKAPGERYTTSSYDHAVTNAVRAANKARACGLCKGLGPEDRCGACKAAAVPHWHPHQLRHTKATEIRREFGLDVARAVLGHRTPHITELYAELDTARAAEVMEKLG
jgi:integrase